MESATFAVLVLVLVIGTLLLAWELFRSRQRNRTSIRLYRVEVQHLRERERHRELTVARIEHELRGPVTVIRGWLEAMLGQDGAHYTDLDRAALERMRHSTTTLSHQVETLLDQQRLRLQVQLTPCDVSEIAAGIVIDYAQAYPQCSFTGNIQPGVISMTDRAGVERMFTELVQNAAIHCDSSGPVIVELTGVDGKFEFSVHNSVKDDQDTARPQDGALPRNGYGQHVVQQWSEVVDASYSYVQKDGAFLATISSL